MSGLLSTISALADDMAVLATKISATSIDDIVTQSAKAIPKTAGILVDDTAVIPQYIDNVAAKRELPIIKKIAWGSLKNKFLMIPLILTFSAFMPWIINPILIAGATFLAFEGIESLGEKFGFIKHEKHNEDALLNEDELVSEAIKTDTVLSVEILVITLASVSSMALLGQAGVLLLVGLLATVGVYGVVAAIIKMDDFGFFLKQKYNDKKYIVSFGNWLVNSMPKLMTLLGWIGAFAMLTVAGGILTHSFHSLSELGVKTYDLVSPFSSLIPGLTPTLEFISPMAPAAVLGITTVLVLNNILKPILLKIKK